MSTTLSPTTTTLPLLFTWSDRRPIGLLSLSHGGFVGPSNSNGWLFDQSKGLIEGFRSYVQNATPQIRRVGAQGVIVRDIEGSKYFSQQYICSPDLAKSITGLLTDEIDRFFGMLKNLGIKVGVGIRPQEFDLSLEKPTHVRSPDPFKTLLRKATYAHDTWGCRLFYVDSNASETPWDEEQYQGQILPATVFARLHEALPRCLFITEFGDRNYARHCAVYRELRDGETETPPEVLNDIPDAFSAINLSGGDMIGRRTELKNSLKRGNIGMHDIWWDDPALVDFEAILKD